MSKKANIMKNRLMGIVGKSIEPVMKPLGFDWHLSVSILSGLAAKEVVVSTLGVIFQADNSSGRQTLVEKIQSQKDANRQKCIHTSYCLFIHAVYSYLFPMCGSGGCNQKGIGKLEMGSVHHFLYYRNSMDTVIYCVPGWEDSDWLIKFMLSLCT